MSHFERYALTADLPLNGVASNAILLIWTSCLLRATSKSSDSLKTEAARSISGLYHVDSRTFTISPSSFAFRRFCITSFDRRLSEIACSLPYDEAYCDVGITFSPRESNADVTICLIVW